MKKYLITLSALVAVLLTAAPAQASTLEAKTRRDAGISAKAVKRVPAYDTFSSGTQFRPEGTNCFTSKTVRKTRVQGRLVQKNRLLQYCTDRYVDERRPARTFVRYIRFAQNNAAEQAEQDRIVRLCETLGGEYRFPGGCFNKTTGLYLPLAGL